MRALAHFEVGNSGGVSPAADAKLFCQLNNVSRKQDKNAGFVVGDCVRVHHYHHKKHHGKFGTVVGHTAAFVSLVFNSLIDDAQVERKQNDKFCAA